MILNAATSLGSGMVTWFDGVFQANGSNAQAESPCECGIEG